MMTKNRFSILLIPILSLASALVSGQKTFQGSIVDAESGLPLAATVSLRNNHGDDLAPDGQHDHVFYLDKKRWYVEGGFQITCMEDSLYIEIRRGLETLPLQEVIYLSSDNSPVWEFRLKRWTDMAAKGFLSGDSHIHFLGIKQLFQQMQAEDLHVVNLLTSDFTHDVELFTGALDEISTDKFFVYVGQEIRDWQLGHANLLDLEFIVQPLDPFGGSLFSMGSNPNLLLSPRLEESHRQGASNVWAHFSNLPGLESAIAFPLGLIDAVELMTYDDPTQLPSHWAPWDYTELSPAEFPPMRGMDLYYQYLNAGFHLPITAGTDKMGDIIPVGSNRNYVRLEGNVSYENWIEGMKKGRGFVTNGPMLTFSVDEHLSGEIVDLQGARTVKAKIKAESLLPFGRVEIVANGKLIAWKYLENYRRKRDVYVAEMEVEIPLSESTWIAGRVTSLDTPEMLPRNLTVFAHSNPVYFEKDNKPVYQEASVNYLLDYLESGRNWIRNYSNFSSKEEKKQAMTYLDIATDIIKGMKHP